METEAPGPEAINSPQRTAIIRLEDTYNTGRNSLGHAIRHDPVSYIHRFPDNTDREIAGFLASQFSYGKIELFRRFLDTLFAIIGNSPSRFIAEADFSVFSGLYYRFQKDSDIIRLFEILRTIQVRYGSVGTLIRHHSKGDTRNTLWAVRADLLGRQRQEELPFFFPKPGSTSPLKRWNLYFRWMVRHDEIDLGIWDFIDKRTLTIPLDTHIFKIARCLGWCHRASPTWNAARDVTDALRTICPEDPLKYDFFLCHGVGILAQCSGKRNNSCRHTCPIYEIEERL